MEELIIMRVKEDGIKARHEELKDKDDEFCPQH